MDYWLDRLLGQVIAGESLRPDTVAGGGCGRVGGIPLDSEG